MRTVTEDSMSRKAYKKVAVDSNKTILTNILNLQRLRKKNQTILEAIKMQQHPH